MTTTATTLTDTSSGATLRRRVVQHLRELIETEQLAPEERLPSLTVLAQRYGVSDITVRAAVKELVDGGYLHSRRGSGVFVRASRPEAGPAQLEDGGVIPPAARLVGHMVAVVSQIPDGYPGAVRETGNTVFIGYGAISAAQQLGIHTLTLHPGAVLGDARRAGEIERLVAMQPYGVIISDTHQARVDAVQLARSLAERGLRVVVCGDHPSLAAFDRVTSDHETGAYLETRWLIEQGRKRIMQVWPAPAAQYWFPRLRAGYERAMNEAGLELLPAVIMPRPEDEESGTREAFMARARQLGSYLIEHLSGPNCVDALMLSTDSDVYRAAAALRLFGRKPNQDVALAGYDNYWDVAGERQHEECGPMVTVDKQNHVQGGALVELLCARAGGQLPAAAQHRIVESKLVVPGQ